MPRFAHYHYQVPFYRYECNGFLYHSAIDPIWYVMDDFGNAVVSTITVDLDGE